MVENKIPIYKLDDNAESVDKIGVMVVDNHCIVILPKNE